MNNNYIYVILKIDKKNGGIEVIKKSDKTNEKEIKKIYDKLKINEYNSKQQYNNFHSRISIYDPNKKSYVDNKTSTRIGSNYYGRLD